MLTNKMKRGMTLVAALGLFAAGVGAEDEAAPKKEAVRELVVRVMDGDGKSVTDAEVYFLVDLRVHGKGRTDAEGRWTGRVPADAKNWAVFARKAKVGFDYAVAAPRRGTHNKLRSLPDRLELTLAEARTLRVKTVDRQGKPISKVKVGPWYIQKPGGEGDINLSGTTELWSKTDQDGIAVLDWLPKQFERAVPILALSDDYYLPDHATPLMADKPAAELTFTLLPMERLSGRVTHADGGPAKGILVSAQGLGAGHNEFRGSVRTGADGRYTIKVYSEQAYVMAVGDDKWAAPYRTDIVVRAGKPVEGVNFVLGRATRLHGRVTVGKDARPVSQTYIVAIIFEVRELPEELRRKSSPLQGVSMQLGTWTDKDGRFELHLGPGVYMLNGPDRTKPVKITIPTDNPPAEIVRNFHMPRPETGPLAGSVLDAEGKPIAEAIVEGQYAAQTGRGFPLVKTDAQGRFQVERSLDPLVLYAQTADKTRAGVVRIDAETPKAKVVVGPLARASGRLLDLQGKPLARKELQYGIRVYLGDPEKGVSTDRFGGKVVTDATGHFTIAGLVPGQMYHVMIQPDEHSYRTVKEVKADKPQSIDLGDLRVDPKPFQPYVPPTPEKQAADAFLAKQQTSPRKRMENVLTESRLVYTRPLLLFGRPKDPACIDLFRLFDEKPEKADDDAKDKAANKRHPPSPYELRWEFELASLDTDRPEVRAFAKELGVPAGKEHPPVLAVLAEDGSLTATYVLRLDDKHKLDGRALAAFLVKHKLATRDAERMLAEALRKAKSEDKRTFFIASASWCGPCRLLARFLASRKDELEGHYVFVKLDISRDKNADAVRKRFQGCKHEGVPWYAILDADGKVLITSNAAESKPRSSSTNIGFPSSPGGIEHFMKMLKQTAPRLSDEQLTEMRAALSKKK